MRANERVAILTAMEKAIKKALSEARKEADADMWSMFDESGIEKVQLRIGDVPVGQMIVTFSKAGFNVTDREEFEDFALSQGIACERKSIKPGMMHSAIKFLENNLEPEVLEETIQTEVKLDDDWEKWMDFDNGCVFWAGTDVPVPGVEYRPRKPKNITVRGCEWKDCAAPISQLGGIDALLLEAGDE